MVTVKELLDLDTVSYDSLLEVARRWRLSANKQSEKKALELLKALNNRFPLAPEIIQELLLVQIDVEPNAVEETVRTMVRDLSEPNEEIICRVARMFKDKGDKYLSMPANHPNRLEQADYYYRLAQEKSKEAHLLRQGHYPGINLATLMLVRAGLARLTTRPADEVQLLAKACQRAQDLLDRRASWPADQPRDREVWHPATEAEAHLLLRRWDRAAEIYRSIPAEPWETLSMRKQVGRILEAWRRLEETTFGPFANLDEVFRKREKKS